jgi:uncharacterized membrane protein
MYKRFWEIDSLRAIAIFMMITFHVLFLLNDFEIDSTNVYSGFWWWFARVTAGTFIFVVGISLTISYAKSPKMRRFLLRGLKIFAWGLVITLVTWLVIPEKYVAFGILHMIGVAIIIGYFFISFRFLNLALGIAFVAAGVYLDGLRFSFDWLLWLGLIPKGYTSADYFPLLPWLGIAFLGIFSGKLLYPNGNRRFKIKEVYNPVTRPLCFLGRHSLIIYLIQWPVVLGILFILYLLKCRIRATSLEARINHLVFVY